jgi:hypothetical protein
MSSSGIVPSDEAMAIFEQIKSSKIDWAIFKISDDEKQIVPVKQFPASYDEKKAFDGDDDKHKNFKERVYDPLQKVIENEFAKVACFVVMDFRFVTDDGARSKIVLVKWCSDSGVKIKQKMLLASSADAFVKKLNGLSVKLQYSSMGDWDYDDTKKAVPQK